MTGPGKTPRGRKRRARWLIPALTAALCAAALALALAYSISLRPGAGRAAPTAAPTGPEAPPAAEETAEAEQTAVPETPPADMLEWKEGQFVHVEYGTGSSTKLDTSGFTDPDTKNSHDLVEWVKMAWENQWGYVWGTFGYVLTEDLLAGKLEQYPEELGEYEDVVREKWMGRRVTDCVGLIKSYGWYDAETGSIEYASGDKPDVGTDGMWQAADVRGSIDTMPDEPGILVWSTQGHIGVYVGGGYAVEAISHAGGVVKTKVADRPWTGWLQCPYIRYDT